VRRALLIFGFAVAASAAVAAQPVTLKASPTDADGRITLSDLFDGASSNAVVAVGPKPGASVVLDAARIQVAARDAGLSWANPAGVRRIVVRAAGPATAAPGALASQAAPVSQRGAVEALTYARSLNAGAVVTADDLTWAPVSRTPSDAPGDAEARSAWR
jgi:flagella basal body P-ring formation protein FlgA